MNYNEKLGVPTVLVSAEQEVSLDNPEVLKWLERRHQANDFIGQWYEIPALSKTERAVSYINGKQNRHPVNHINNQFMTKIFTSLMTEDVDSAFVQFSSLSPNTNEEELALLLSYEEFTSLYEGMHGHLAEVEEHIGQHVAKNQNQIAWNDKYQFNPEPRRSLEVLEEQGVRISVDEAGVEILRQIQYDSVGNGVLPLLEYVKNEKIFTINGFKESKVSHSVHDFMDHLWVFRLMRDTGVQYRYSEMFDSIGNPEKTDLFKREGEIVSSIAFGTRYFQTMEQGFQSLIDTSDIKKRFDDLFTSGKLLPRHIEAYKTLTGLKQGSREWQSLGFSFSNYITELDEQRRKHGIIKTRDTSTGEVTGELDPWSSDFLGFFVDTHHQILLPKNQHHNDLFRYQILLESFLVSLTDGSKLPDENFVVKPGELRDIDYNKTELPPERLNWMYYNYGFVANKSNMF
jgi:uncharacterized protein YkuJ